MQFIRVSDVVNDLCNSMRDFDRSEFLQLMIESKSVTRELKLKYVNDFVRVYLPINQATMTVRLPLDFMRFRTISLIEECRNNLGVCIEKVIPLTHNPYINITPVPTEPLNSCNVCACTPTHPVCSELSNYTQVCEEVMVDPNASPPLTGTKQTVLRTCSNGDIVKEVTQPTQKFIEGDMQCDYTIETVLILDTVCDYTLTITGISVVAPTENIRMIINGEIVDSGALSLWVEVNAYFVSLGWSVDSNGVYHLTDSLDVYETLVTVTQAGGEIDEFTLVRHCEESNKLTFPYTINSYTKNGIIYTESPPEEIINQAAQDVFFTGLGFTKVDDTHYTAEGSTDVFFYITVDIPESPPLSPPITYTVNFVQSNCHRPLISDGVSNATTTDVLCNVPVHEGCLCIVETPETIATICDCCSSLLNCCQNGALTGWNGWGYVPQCLTNSPQPYNIKGTYSLDETNYLIYLDSVCATKVLLSYDSDGGCDGDYVFPAYMLEAFKGGLAWKHAQYNEEITPFRRRELKMNFQEELSKLSREYTDVIRVADLISALKTLKTPY